MKHTTIRVLALLIALMLAVPGFAFAEAPVDGAPVTDDAAYASDLSGDEDAPVEEWDDFTLGDNEEADDEEADDTEADPQAGADAAPVSPAAFDQSVAVGAVTIAVTAGAGAFPEGSVLQAGKPEDGAAQAAKQAAETALEGKGQLEHHLFSIEVLDAAENPSLPDYDLELPRVKLTGLEVSGEVHVLLYDPYLEVSYELDATADDGEIRFAFVDSAIYDIVGVTTAEAESEDTSSISPDGEPASPQGEAFGNESQEPSPDGAAEGLAERPGAEQSEAEEVEASDDTNTNDEANNGDTSSVSPDGEPASPQGEAFGDAGEEVSSPDDAPTDDAPDDTPDTPDAINTDAEANDQSLDDASDGSLSEGTGSPEGEAEGATDPEADATDDDASDEGADEEAIPFEQSQTVAGVVVTVRAEPGAFPEGAALSVKRVPVYKARQADAAIDEVRDEDQNVAVSYTFDIKVMLDGEELQPADGYGVEVSFALEEAGDANLEANVYHIEEEHGALTAEKLDTDVDENTETVTAISDGFSLYTVEFTYNNLEYVLQGDESVALGDILSALGLTGTAERVTVSDARLFSASDATGEWVIESHEPFSTTEWMKVWIDGIKYEITVTDDQQITTWAELQTALNAGGTVVLTQDLTAGVDDAYLSITTGKSVTLDLNGHTLDAAENTNYVFYINGTNAQLTLTGDGTVTGATESGVYVFRSTFEMSGGTITGNGNEDEGQGGVHVFGSTFEMSGGTISGNTSEISGGGVNMGGNSTFTMSGGTISGNKASRSSGGGVNVSNGTFTMSGGTISGNRAKESGGGVYVGYNATFNLSGGEITDNALTGANFDCGGGVYVYSAATFNLSGSPVVRGNTAEGKANNVYLFNGESGQAVISVDPEVPLDAQCDVGVTVAGSGAFTSGYGNKNSGVAPSTYFFSDATNKVVSTDGNWEAILADADGITYRKYVEANSCFVSDVCTSYTEITNGNQPPIWLDGTWYVVKDTVPISGRVTVTGNVNLILLDGKTLTVPAGITVASGSSLTIYGQAGGTGRLYAGCKLEEDDTLTTTCDTTNAGIGGEFSAGGNVTVHGGVITANGGKNGAGIGGGSGGAGGTINIYGGTVTATSEYGAGIGSGSGGTGGTINIYGGTVTATSPHGAGIGGGDGGVGGTVTISGGTVNATGGGFGAGIGNGEHATATNGTITISGGTVNAIGSYGAGIGTNCDSKITPGNIIISGGRVTATSQQGAGIGRGSHSSAAAGNITLGWTNNTDFIHASSYDGTVTLTKDFKYTGDTGVVGLAATGTNALDAATLTAIADKKLTPATLYAITDATTIANGAVAHKAKAAAGETVTLTIAPASGYGLGKLTVTYADVNDVTQTVETTQGTGDNANTYTFTMPDANVTVSAVFLEPVDYIDPTAMPTSQKCASYDVVDTETTALTAGWWVVNSDVTITDRVTVTGDVRLILCDGKTLTAKAGITVANSDSLTIYAQSGGTGKLYAGRTASSSSSTCADNCAGIGGDSGDSGGSVTIHGGKVYATGSRSGAGIGGGSVAISGGSVTAKSSSGAGIGGGSVAISGGKVEATSSSGAGMQCSDGKAITLSYTNATRVGMCVYASSYSGTVKLLEPFRMKYFQKTVFEATGDGALSEDDKNAIKNRDLIPYSPFSVTFNCGEHGDVSADRTPANYYYDEYVTLTMIPDGDGYVVETLTAKCGDADVNVTEQEDGTYTFSMPEGDVVVSATFVQTEWQRMQNAIDAAGAGGTVHLAAYVGENDDELTATSVDRALRVRAGQDVTIDLDGLTINRNLTDYVINGNVITVEAGGKLTLTDSSAGKTGVVTGGSHRSNYCGGVLVKGTFDMNGGTISNNVGGNGGGVYVSGASAVFNLSGGTICDNTTVKNGGGVYVNRGTFNMTGGTISENKTGASNSGGGVYVTDGAFNLSGGAITNNASGKTSDRDGGGVCVYSDDATFTLSGNPTITGNTAGDEASNLFLHNGKVIRVTGRLTNTIPIGIKMQIPGVFTDGLPGYGSDANFSSDVPEYPVVLTSAGEAELGARNLNVTLKGLSGVDLAVHYELKQGDLPPEPDTYFPTTGKKTFAILENEQATLTLDLEHMNGSTLINWVESYEEDGVKKQKVISTGPSATFVMSTNRDVTVNFMQCGIIVKVDLNGREWADTDKFEFYLSALNGAPKPWGWSSWLENYEITSASLDHSDTFGNDTFQNTYVGNTFTYEVSLTSTLPEGIVLDATKKTVSFTLTDGGGTVACSPAAVQTVTFTNVAPVFTVADLDLTYGYTSGNTLEAVVNKVDGYDYAYQWYTCDSDGSNATAINGAFDASYTVPTGKDAGAYYFLCEVGAKERNTHASCTTTGDPVKVTVSPAPVTLTANGAEYTYDGTEKTVTGFTCSVDGLKFTGVSASGKGTDAGSYDVTFSGVTLNQTMDTSGNYVVTKVEDGTLTIKPQPVTLTANGAEYTYDGTEKTVTGFTCSVDGLTFAKAVKASGKGTDAGSYDVTFSGVTPNTTTDTTGNYVVTKTVKGKLTIKPAAVTLTANSGEKIYNGKAQSVTGFTCSVKGLSFTGVSASGKGTNTGTYPATFSGVTVNTTKDTSGNYVVTQTVNGTLTINKATMDASRLTAAQKPTATNPTYNGAPQALVEPPASLPEGYTKVQYSVDGGQTWSDEIPTGTDIGSYMVNVKYVGDANHEDFQGASITSTIAAKPSGTLIATMVSAGPNALQLTWTEMEGVAGYDIFFRKCDGKNQFPLVATVKSPSVTSHVFTDLKKNTSYKAYVRAWILKDGKKQYVLKKSPEVHAFTNDGTKRYSNPGSLKLKKSSLKVKKGKTARIEGTIKPVKRGKLVYHHMEKLRYVSSDPKVAKVSSNGKVKAVGVGKCKIYVLTTNGICKTVTITVTSARKK